MGRTTATFLALLALSAANALAHDSGMLGAALHGRRMEILVKRQNITIPTTTPAGIVVPTTTPPLVQPTTTTAPAAAQVTTSASPAGNVLNTVLGDLTSSSSVAVLPTTSSTTPARVLTTTTPSSSAATTSSVASSSSTSLAQTTVVTTTSTSSSTQSATAAADTTKKSSSGISHTALIIIIAVASSVAGIAAIWTIVRKTAFSPSRRFEAKLEPIDFGGNKHDSFVFPAHGRSDSQLSGGGSTFQAPPGYPASLARSDSAKSHGAAPMAEVSHIPGSIPYSQPGSTGYGPPRSYTSSPAPGYPAEPDYGYSNLQRGASSRYPAAAPGPYNYQQQYNGRW